MGGEGGNRTRESMPPLAFKKPWLKLIERGKDDGPTQDMIDALSFCIDKNLTQDRVVVTETPPTMKSTNTLFLSDTLCAILFLHLWASNLFYF
jgi:hypothetical protein